MNSTLSQTSIAETASITPINVLNIVALDTETTGLDTTSDRLLQVGAVRLLRGKIDHHQTFEAVVNPGIPIPQTSTAIHGLKDQDVIDASDYRGIKTELENWIGNSIIIGYAIGFDLAIFERENQLANLAWTPPRTLDIRHMVKILAPQLPDYSLDTIANWLGINTDQRHQALGDAVIAAEVFIALVPKLLIRGVRTLAELEAACRLANDELITEAQAGWYDFLNSKQTKDLSQHAIARIDSFPYCHRVRDTMSSPPVCLTKDVTISSLLPLLMEKKISSAFIIPETDDRQYGIITERDILRTIAAKKDAALGVEIGECAQYPLVTVLDDAFVYLAMGRMARHGFRHLGVINKHNQLVGALSSRDLLKQRADDAFNLGDAIDHAHTEHDLNVVWANLALVTNALDQEGVDVRDTAAVISNELCALTRRACEIVEMELAHQGFGKPPVPYAMLVLGSGGRGESLLAMDQDNAIIYESGNPGGQEDTWFEKLGVRVADLLNSSGVPYCNGGVMAKNPDWRMSVANWKDHISTWINRTSPEDILKIDIFFDAISVHGDNRLMDEVYNFAINAGSESREFLHLLANNAADVHSPINMFGRFKLKDGRVDVKMGGILPIFSATRVEAIRHQIHQRTTPERLEAMRHLSDRPTSLIDNLIEAHKIILAAILKQQLDDLAKGIPLTNCVAPDSMSGSSRNSLKWALQQAPSIVDLIGVPA